MDAKKAYQEQVEAQLKRWCAEVEQMLAEANRVQNVTMIARLHTLVDQQSAAQQQFQALKQADAESWATLKATLDVTLAELLEELEGAGRRLSSLLVGPRGSLRRTTSNRSVGPRASLRRTRSNLLVGPRASPRRITSNRSVGPRVTKRKSESVR